MDDNASHVYRRTIDLESGDSLAMIGRQIRPGSTVLELGPATGYFTEFLKESLGCEVDGVELSPEMAEEARPWFRKLLVGDVEQMDLRAEFPGSGYDYVICADILEHLRDPGGVMAQLSDLLSPDGRLLASVPNIAYGGVILELLSGDFRYRDEGLLDRTHLRFFTRESFGRLLTGTGYLVADVSTVTLPYSDSEFRDLCAKNRSWFGKWILAGRERRVYQYIFNARVG